MHRKKDRSNFKSLGNGIVLLILLLTALIAGCSGDKEKQVSREYYEIDPLFREIYLFLGGPEVLGPAISPAKSYGSITAQWLETGKMVYDPAAPIIQKFYLASLGKDLGYNEPVVPQPVDPEILYVDGHTILPDFQPLYEKLGARMVGKPLTEGYFHLIHNRYEQHFENVGLYRMNGSDEVHLLPYGIMACGEDCPSFGDRGNARIDIRIDPTFQQYVNTQGSDFTGYALSDAYLNEEGLWEQIMENVVLVADSANNPQSARLKPLADKIGIQAAPVSPKSGNPDFYFFPTVSDLGYEIPLYFFEYLNRHGGLVVTGPPIAPVTKFDTSMRHQCFTNLCLMYDPAANEGGRVRSEPLGYAYMQLYYKETVHPKSTSEPASLPGWPTPPGQAEFLETSNSESPPEAAPPEQSDARPGQEDVESSEPQEQTISFRAWEKFPVLATGRIQEIGIEAKSNGQPISRLPLELTVTMPDGAQQYFVMPKTTAEGRSSIALPPFDAPNGTIIPYVVCIRLSNLQKICLEKSFIIWDYP